jgi:hypothetical protein
LKMKFVLFSTGPDDMPIVVSVDTAITVSFVKSMILYKMNDMYRERLIKLCYNLLFIQVSDCSSVVTQGRVQEFGVACWWI